MSLKDIYKEDEEIQEDNPVISNDENQQESIQEEKVIEEDNQTTNQNNTELIINKLNDMNQNLDIEVITNKLDSLEEKINQDQIVSQLNDINLKLDKNNHEDVDNAIVDIQKKQNHIESLLSNYIGQNSKFQQEVRIQMNQENETLKKEILGERINPFLKQLASIYCEYYSLLNVELDDNNTKKQIEFMFDSIQEMLEDEGCEFHQTKAGEERSARLTKIKQPLVKTGDSSLHRKVIESLNPSVVKGNKVLYPEYVKVYVYDEELAKENEEVLQVEEEKNEEETLTVDDTETNQEL